MSSRMTLAKQLIQSGEFDIAKSMLSKEQNDPQALYLLSLLHRYDDEYDQELGVIKQSLDIDGGNAYMRDRLAWHNLPLFDRVVPRKPLNLPRDPDKIPSQEVLDKFAIVSGSDSGYFHFLVQLIESIQNGSLYCDIPICVLDCGLTEEEKNILIQKYRIKNIKKANWKIEPTNKMINVCGKMLPLTEGYKAIMNKPYLFEYFPEYEYLCWIDADCWVQDQRFLDKIVSYADQFGVGVTSFNNNNNVATGVYCIKKSHPFIQLWQKNYGHLLQSSGFAYGGEEFTLVHSMRALGIAEFLSVHSLCRISQSGVPYILSGTQTLCVPETGVPLDIYAFDAFTEKDVIFWPLNERISGFSSQEEFNQYFQKSKWLSQQQKNPEFLNLKVFDKQKISSLHYRTWPWVEQNEIKQLIMGGL